MKFPNAYKGVKKLYLIAIIGLFVTIAGLVSVALLALCDNNEGLKNAGLGIGSGVAILALILFIVQMVGLNQASKDELNFRTAFRVIILSIILGLAGSIFGAINNDVAKEVGKYVAIASDAASLVALEYTFRGIMGLSDKYGNQEMHQQGQKLIFTIWVLWCVAMGLRIVGNIFNTNAADWVKILVAVVTIVAAIAEIVVTLITYVYYRKAVKMLEK